MSATSKISKSSLVNSLAKRYDPRTIQNQGPTNVQKPSQTPVVSKTPTSISIMDTKLDFLNQKIDTILVEQNNAFEKLENVSQDIVDIEKDLQEIKKESTKAEKTNEILEDKDIFLEMKGHFVEMISHLSSINKYSEEQAKRLDGVEKILLGTQSVIHFLMKQIKLSTVFEFLQRKQNLTKPPLVNSKINKQERKENIKEKGKNSAKGVETNRKKDTHLNKRNKKFINDQITSEQKKNVPLSLKGTKSLKKKKPPDAEKTVKKFSKKKKQKEQNILLSIVSVEEYFPERSVQKTHYRKHKEKVQKLNRENTEASVILVENKSPEIKYEENFISIDIPNSHIKTHVQDGSPIIFSVEECEEPMPATEEPVQALPEVSEKAVDTGESFTDVQKDKGEKEIVILVTEDAPHIETENKYEEDEGKHEALDEQEDDDSIHNITDCEEIKAVQDSTESIASEGSKQTVSGTDTCDHLSVCPAYADTELETTCTFLTKSGENEEDVPTLSTEEEEETEEEEDEIEEETVEECSQNGDICYNDQGCNSKRRVTDQQHTKEDSKKSRLDTKDTEESTTSQDTEEKPNDLIINKEAQACECAEENKEQSSIKEEEELLILDVTPPPPAPFDHRIVSAKHAQINNFYTVEKTQVLGGGRFGQVYRCVEKSSGLTLAAKIIKVKGHKQKEETKNEIQVMNQLNHTNLIQLYDAFESRNDIILVMEYIDGGELFDRIIDENCNLSEVDTILFIKQICEGIQFMHQMYIIHLDLKPENIMCVSRADYQIKIIDFGLARRYKPREKLKVHFGTPEFLAPEVVNYDFVSFPTDMWSVGVIAYMLLSGLSPFLGEDDNETLNNIVVSQFDFEGDEFQSISESAKEFISKLLIKEKCWRMSATEALKHPWLSDSRLHYRISQQVSEMRKMQSCSVSEAPVSQ